MHGWRVLGNDFIRKKKEHWMVDLPDEFSLPGIVGTLMTMDNLGDVHNLIFRICDHIGVPEPEGDFVDGWKAQDWRNVGVEPQEEDDEGE